ncbi:MAG: hypothetical protein ACYC7G_08780 [Rudaea sp.]
MKKEAEIDPLDREFSLETLRGKGVRGKYAARMAKGSNIVRLTPEIARAFPTEEAVNEALRGLMKVAKRVAGH